MQDREIVSEFILDELRIPLILEQLKNWLVFLLWPSEQALLNLKHDQGLHCLPLIQQSLDTETGKVDLFKFWNK